jgi:hypothetical protein
MPNWYFQNRGSAVHGPMSSKELIAQIHSGEVRAETLIRKDDSQWSAANQINGLWQAASKTTYQYRCPDCKHIIAQPPTNCSGCGRRIRDSVRESMEHSVTETSTSTSRIFGRKKPINRVAESKLVNESQTEHSQADIESRRQENENVRHWLDQLLRRPKHTRK